MKIKKPDIASFNFTPSEMKVARELAKGDSRKEIADKIKISVLTVDVYLKMIRLKMHVNTTMRAGIILSEILS